MVSVGFILLLLAAACFAVLVIRSLTTGGGLSGSLLPLGLLLWELPALIAAWP